MKRFAFYGRVSTEDQQDPESSKSWQLARATQLISSEGQVVADYFDIGQSRSLPWKRRPESARLLADLKRADRAFDAVVIGEPARAFYGNQFGLTFPVFTHYGIELWVPEVGGAVDPGSDAHDLVMALYGGMSKGERNRIKIRVRSAMASQAAEGRFLGGRPPYGYRLADGGPHPNPGKAANGQRLHYLERDPATAPIVERIFAEYLAGSGIYAIAEGLTRDGVPCPSAADPKRNWHRSGIAWSKGAVRAILRNPRYTGREVWNKQRRDETLIDVEDVALGHETKLRWNEADEWIWSAETTHEPIVDPETFARASSSPVPARSGPLGGSTVARTPTCSAGSCGVARAALGCRATGTTTAPTTAAGCRPSTPSPTRSTTHPPSTCARTTSSPHSTSGSPACSTPPTSTTPSPRSRRLKHRTRPTRPASKPPAEHSTTPTRRSTASSPPSKPAPPPTSSVPASESFAPPSSQQSRTSRLPVRGASSMRLTSARSSRLWGPSRPSSPTPIPRPRPAFTTSSASN